MRALVGLIFLLALAGADLFQVLGSVVPRAAVPANADPCLAAQCLEAKQLLTQFDPERVQQLYYPVYGLTRETLLESIRLRGPSDAQGVSRDASFLWYLYWDWPTVDGKAQFSQATADYQATLTLPQWQDYARASPELRALWDKYFLVTVRHELGHYQILLSDLQAPARAIQDLARSAQVVSDADAHAAARAAVQRLHERDTRYDRETDHGTLHGARLG